MLEARSMSSREEPVDRRPLPICEKIMPYNTGLTTVPRVKYSWEAVSELDHSVVGCPVNTNDSIAGVGVSGVSRASRNVMR